MANQGGSREQHERAGQQSHKNDDMNRGQQGGGERSGQQRAEDFENEGQGGQRGEGERRGGSGNFADDPDRFVELHDPWAVDPPLKDAWLLKIHANRSAFRALLDGEAALARLRQQRAPSSDSDVAPGHLGRWSDGIIGLSYLWEGQVLLAERILRPALLQADADLGRRNPFPCMLAALLAARAPETVGQLWLRQRVGRAGHWLADMAEYSRMNSSWSIPLRVRVRG